MREDVRITSHTHRGSIAYLNKKSKWCNILGQVSDSYSPPEVVGGGKSEHRPVYSGKVEGNALP